MGCSSNLSVRVLVAGFILLLLVGIHESEGKKAKMSSTHQGEEVIGREKLFHHPQSDINFMSKRRVPNGPDPIHNRRAGNSRRPPGRA